jgi:hypothetical protein
MGSSGQQQSTSQSRPLAATDPYISQYLSALGIYDNPLNNLQVPQQQIAGLSGQQQQGLSQIPGEAGQAAGLGNAATSSAENIIGGGNLNVNSNPALQGYLNTADQQLVNQYQNATAPSITAQAVQQGGLGSSGANQAQQYGQYGLGQDLASTNATILNNAYNAGLNQQTQVLGQTPSLQQGAFTPSSGLISGGNLQQTQAQNVLNALYQNQMGQFQLPFQQLGQYGQGVSSMAGTGGTSVSTSTPGSGSFK